MRTLMVWLTALSSSALAAPAIVVNGKAHPQAAQVIGGQTYIPVSVLNSLGVPYQLVGGKLVIGTAPAGVAGGANPLAAQQGCLNQTLFNGVWRVKFSNLRLAKDADGTARWNIDLEVRNATAKMMTGADGMLFADSQHLAFTLPDSTPMNWGVTDELNGQKFTYATLPPAGVWKGTLTNVDGNNASAARRPVKVLWRVAPSEGGDFAKALPWGVSDPSFRVDLTCSK